MYRVKFSLWLTGAVGPQAVAGRHSSTRPLAGVTSNMYPPPYKTYPPVTII